MLILQLDMDQQGGDYTLHTQLLDITLLLYVERLHITPSYRGSAQSWLLRYSLQPLYAVWLGWAGLGWALQLHIKYQILQRHSKHFSCVSDETRARGHQQ